MFCRYCGAVIAEDSLFCPKCGKRLDRSAHPAVEKVVTTLHLKTPYPYFILMVIVFVTWMAWPTPIPAAYTQVKWTLDKDKILDRQDESLYQQSMSLVMENKGSTPVKDVRVDLIAKIEPQKTAKVVAGFLGGTADIMENGKPLPLTIVLADKIDPGEKHRYLLEGAITAKTPFKVTYEVHEEGSPTVLASFVVERN